MSVQALPSNKSMGLSIGTLELIAYNKGIRYILYGEHELHEEDDILDAIRLGICMHRDPKAELLNEENKHLHLAVKCFLSFITKELVR